MVSPQSKTTTYHYDAVGNRDSVISPNGTTSGYQYDNLNRLTRVRHYMAGTILAHYAYALNAAGIRTQVTEKDSSKAFFTYDSLYRLKSERRTGNHTDTMTYTYDPVGNRLTKVHRGVTTNYAYNNRDQLFSEWNGTDSTLYAYDSAGRMLTKTEGGGTTHYRWRDEDRLDSLYGPGVSVKYQYDAEGRRVKDSTGSTVKQYLIDPLLPYGQVISETDGSNSLVAEYVYGNDRVSQRRGTTSRYFLADGQGSIRMLTDSVGVVTDSNYYTAFGEDLYASGSTPHDFKYVGEQLDGNSGFYYNRARWMDPKVGRFESVDPFDGDPQASMTLHRYLYASASPIVYVDPTGEAFFADLVVGLYIRAQLIAIRIAPYIPLLGALRKDPAALTQLANEEGGPTVQVLTNLASSPQANRALSVATNITPDELREAVGAGQKVFQANIPQALLSRMLANQMVQKVITEMNDVILEEYRFTAEGANYVLHLFKEVP